MFNFSNYLSRSIYCNDSNKLVIGKMKNETSGVASEEFFRLKVKIYSFFVDNSEHKKAKHVNRNVFATTSHDEYKNVLMNNECL